MITLTLTLDQVNAILILLGKASYEASADLIQEIRKQGIPQLPQEEKQEVESSEE